jgi:hypothetical protein
MSVVIGQDQASLSAALGSSKARRYGLLARITCPHCWFGFSPDEILWVSEHIDLMGDSVLGPEQPLRFLPSRFSADRQALDAKGTPCRGLACPRCHLAIPRALVENEPMFLSIIGGPASGKSYLLAAMTWNLRKQLTTQFDLHFNDADTVANRHLNAYEEKLFLTDDQAQPVYLEKTELEGALYEHVNLHGQPVLLPKPFLFTLRPAAGHSNASKTELLGRVICLYDNAGEHFQPGNDSVARPGTQHLGFSRALMFLFDPTQDPRFREQCRQFSKDPQLVGKAKSQRQETLLTEAAHRVRRYGNLPPNKKHDRPLVVLVSKSDVWGRMLGEDVTSEPLVLPSESNKYRHARFDIARVDDVSTKLRRLLLQWTPEVVTAAEDFCEHVVYIPVSALGASPEPLPEGGLGVRPRDIHPHWVTVPILYMLTKWAGGYIATSER